jgi:AraC family transcriptional regulator of adaptative response / DNA-3-methyladenine glycosylase II
MEGRMKEVMDLDATRCYRAILSRDRRFDGRFFSGVRTTGIYCRPICPARTPKPENIEFFSCAAAAEAAGYRPCLRCRPEASPGTPAWLGSSAVVSRALKLIGEGALDEGDVDALAARLGVGARQLRRLFGKHLGASPIAVAIARRVHFARRLLDETELPVAQVAHSAGFASIRQFNHALRSTFGRSPRELRQGRSARRPARAEGALTVRLPFRPPLEWRAMLGFLAARATPGVEQVADGVYRRTIDLGGVAGVVEVRQDTGQSHLYLTMWLPTYDGLRQIVERARRAFDLGADPLQIARQLRRSPVLTRRLEALPGIRVPGAWDPFELAVRAILGQQVTVKGATTLAGRLVATFGRPLETDMPGLTHLFPQPETLADADLARIGLPGARARTIRALARSIARGELELDASLGLEDFVDRLCAVPGLGPWTAHYIAMRALGEPDAFPASDLGLRRAVATDGRPLDSVALADLAEAWRPWRAYAALLLWASPEPVAQPGARAARSAPARRAPERGARHPAPLRAVR